MDHGRENKPDMSISGGGGISVIITTRSKIVFKMFELRDPQL